MIYLSAVAPRGGSHDGGSAAKRRRWLLGLEPFFEGGWLHKGKRAQSWDVEDGLIAVALVGDVTIDLARAKSTPAELEISAWAILRDVEVIVADGTQVELSGGGIFGKLSNEVPAVPRGERKRVVRIKARTLTPISDVTVRAAQ